MSRFFRLAVDEDTLTNELYQFVVDPNPSRAARPVVDELHDVMPEAVEVLECMILDGVEEREFVADYVHYVLGEMTLGTASPARA